MKFLSANKFIIAALVLCLSACVLVFIISVNQTIKVKNTSAEVIHTNKVLGSLDDLITTTLQLQNSTRGFIITGDERMLDVVKQSPALYKEAIETIRQQEGRTLIYTKQLDSLALFISKRLSISEKVIMLKKNQKIQEAISDVTAGEGSYYADRILDICHQIKSNELQRQNATRTSNEKAILNLNTILYAALVTVALLGILLFLKVRKSFNEHRSGERKFKALLESAPDAMLITGIDGAIELVNREAEKMFGYSRQELTGMLVEKLIPHDRRNAHIDLRGVYSQAPRVRNMDADTEMYALKKDGSIIPVEISLSPINTNGETFVAAAIRDITQRKNAQEQIQNLFTQINQANEAIYVLDSDLIISSWNKGAENLYGYTKEEAIGKNSLELLQTRLTEDEIKEAWAVIAQLGFWAAEIKRKTKKGDEVYVYSSLSAVKNNKGNGTSYVSVSFDITQRKKLQRQVTHLANIVEYSSEAIISRDMNRNVISWNKGAEKMFGFTKEEALGKTADTIGFVNLTADELADLGKSIQEKGVWKSEVGFFHKNGNAITGAVTANAVRDESGELTSIVFVIKDISLRKLLEQQLREHNEELEVKVKIRTEEIAQSEKKYRLLYDNNPMPMWVFDLGTFEFLDVNEAALKMYGYSRDEFLSMSVLDIRPEAEKDKFRQEDHSYYRTAGDFSRGIWTHVKKDGTLIKVEIFAHSILFEDRKARLTLVNNVTEKIKAEEKLVASEKRFRALIENNFDVIVMLDKNLSVLYRSPSSIRVTGRSDKDVIGHFISDYIHPEDLPKLKDIHQSLLKEPGAVEEFVFRYLHLNGTNMWFEGNATNLLQEEGVNAIVLNIRDVTDKVNAQQELEASEKRFRALIENSYDIITMLDKDFNVLYRSPSARRVTGRDNEDVLGLDGRKKIHPDDIPIVTAGIKRLLAAPGNVEECIFRYMRSDGSYLWMEGNATNLLHDESIKAIVFNYRDVTERVAAQEKLKASEERYRTTLDNMMEGVQIIGFDWKYKYVNNAVVTQAKCSKEDLLDRTIMDVYPGIEQTDLFRAMQDCFTGHIPIQLENKFAYPDGNVAWFELSIQPVAEGIFILSVDITERINAAEALKEERDKLATIAATSPGLIYSFRMKPDGTFSFPFVSNAIDNIFGLPPDFIKEDISTLIQDALHEDMDLVIGSIKNSAENMTPWQQEFRYHHPVKGIVWLEGNSLPTKEADGSIIWHGIIMDITERVKAAEALEEEREKLMKIADTSPGLIYSFRMMPDGTFNCPFTSIAVEEIFGISHEEAASNITVVIERTDDEDRDRLIQSIRESAATMSPWQTLFRYHHPVKGKLWLQGNSLPVKEADGSILWHGIIVDITEQKKTEEKIVEKIAQVETLSNNLPGVMIYQLTGDDFETRKFSYISKEVTRLTGKTPEEVMAEPMQLYGLIEPEDIPKLVAAEKRSYEELTIFNEEVRCRNYKGELRWLNIISTPRTTNEGKMVWDGFHIDITDRKKSEAALHASFIEKGLLAERLSTILNTLPANIALLDENGIVVDVNQSWVQFASVNEWQGGGNSTIGDNYVKRVTTSFSNNLYDGQKVAAGIKAVLNRKAVEFVYEYACVCPKHKHWFRMIVSPLQGEGYTGAVVMHIDISEIRRLEEERMKSKTEEQKIITKAILQGQEKERNAIGKELHDNINQILAGVNMLLGLINKRPERLNELLPLCIDHMSMAMTENRKIAHQLVSPDEESADLIELIKRTTNSMLQKAGITVKIDCDNFDEDLLNKEQKLAMYRIIQEQCTNIIKYAKATRVLLLLHSGVSRFLLVVKDNGRGMDKMNKNEGIGLQNIKSRVNVLNGIVSITSKPGEGFMLSVDIPIKNARRLLN